MNPNPTQPDADATEPAASPDLVDAIALEAVTTPVAPPEGRAIAVGDESDPMVGRRLGAYRLVARIGGGRMGSVYLAERIDDYRQQVAIKLIERGMDADAIVRRFRTEVHVQAALAKHPNIAGLLDAGTAEDGRPYFVMEHVDGQRIDEDCDSRRLDVLARLRLFAQVCDAVMCAHQHCVIHRDLKPGNILVTGDGVPRLLDCGIARLIDVGDGGIAGADADADVGRTRTGEVVITPEYASPEQVQGEPVTTASDVYSLGVVLYQLLTGRQPYRLEARTMTEVFLAICEQVPERPSTAVVRRRRRRSASHAISSATTSAPSEETTMTASGLPPEEVAAARGTTPVGLRRALAGDVDAIALLALRKEPERRYAAVAELADDLRRHLDGRPVRARGDSAVYRAGRFARRRPAVVAAAAAVVLALLAVIVGTTRGLVLTRRERDRAAASSRQARRAVDQFFTRVAEERLLEQPGMHLLRKRLLQDAQKFYEEFLAERGGDPSLRAELAGARGRLARITADIGSPAEAVEQYRHAIELWDDLLRSHPGDSRYQEELADTLNGQAVVLMRMKGRRGEALDACRRARAFIEAAISEDRATAARRGLSSRILLNMALVQFQQGHPREATKTLEHVIQIAGQLTAEDPRALDPRTVLADALGLLGQIQLQESDGASSALASYQRAVEIREGIGAEHPGLADQTFLLATDLGDLSVAQQGVGKLDSALQSGRRSIEVFERLGRQYPDFVEYQQRLARAYNLLSDLHHRRGEPAESLAFAEKSRPVLERLIAEHSEDVHARVELSKTYTNIGRTRQRSGEPSEALQSFQRAVDLLEGLPDLDPVNSYNLACNLSLCIPLIGAKEGTQAVEDPEALSPGDRIRREVYGDRAIEVLRRAVSGGFLNSEILLSDTDLAAIRGRADFQQLVKDADNQATPGSKS